VGSAVGSAVGNLREAVGGRGTKKQINSSSQRSANIDTPSDVRKLMKINGIIEFVVSVPFVIIVLVLMLTYDSTAGTPILMYLILFFAVAAFVAGVYSLKKPDEYHIFHGE